MFSSVILCMLISLDSSRGSAAQTNGRILLLGTVLLYMSTASYMAALIWSWKNRNYFVQRANDGLFRVSPLYDGAVDAAALKHAVRQQSWLLTFALGTNVGATVLRQVRIER